MNKKLIIIPFNIPWLWSTDYTQQTAFELAKKGYTVVCYLWSDKVFLKDTLLRGKFPKIFSKFSENIFLIQPWYILPFVRLNIVYKLNEFLNIFLLKFVTIIFEIKEKYVQKIFWVFDPNTYFMFRYFSYRYKLVYDCVDYFPGAVEPKFKKSTIENEKELLKQSDLVVANSSVLLNYLHRFRKDVRLVPQGFRLDLFKSAAHKMHIKRDDRPLVGFVGAVNYRIDYKLLYSLANSHHEWDFAIWGPILERDLFTKIQKSYLTKLNSLNNVIFGESNKTEVSAVINEFDIGIIPYNINLDFNKYCYPMKVFEYFYCGKPVISTDIIELRNFPELVNICKTKKEWESAIKELLSKKFSVEQKRKSKRVAIENSWSQKVSKILNYLP